MIGLIFLVIALVFGRIGITLLSSIPFAIFGTLLLYAGIELALLIKDVKEKRDLFIVLIVAGIGFATTNMGIAIVIGIVITKIIKWKDIQI
jgi:SulP family sulfate permease